ncbi:fungal transcriptional regulatory, n-terminal [Trichoderma arundinaceum]|uniref:Fungal transcriptional regulatory, n-terminal n=1 Tax=Trichoderma arundinaceum TaxID=490622 RepID=A0A395NXM1_TRIAR|nr:fungal transcriptional regulatory, n-terminal [Trichoderma arundinaceum]
MCNLPSEFMLAPLPARRQLWEAGDQLEWEAEVQREPGAKAAFGLAAHGGLVKLDERELCCNDAWLPYDSPDTRGQSRSNASWEEWCSGIDGFGGLVMLAASMVA